MGKGHIRGKKGSNTNSSNNCGIEKKTIDKPSLMRRRRTSGSSVTPSAIDDDQPPPYGYIFMCNGQTKADCFKFRVFGLPPSRAQVVLDQIKPRMKLFLYDFDLKLLYGVFVAASNGQLGIEPTAFSGRFSAQVRFQVFKDCLPLPESVFKPAIIDNYQGFKFRQELNMRQVENLMSLFRPTSMPPSHAVASSMPAAVSLKESDEPPGFEESTSPHNQDLPVMRIVQLGRPHHSQHTQHIERPYAHVSPQVSGANQWNVNLSGNQSELQRYAAAARDNEVVPIAARNAVDQAHPNVASRLSTISHGHGHGHMPSKTLSAAYWISVANEGLQKEMYSSSAGQCTPSASMGIALSESSPIEDGAVPRILLHPPTGNYHTSSAAAAAVVVPTSSIEHVPSMHVSSSWSSTPGYWTAITPQEQLNHQAYSGSSHCQQVAGPPPGAENGAAAYYSVPEVGVYQQCIPGESTQFDYYKYNHGTVPATNLVPGGQAHDDSAAYYYYSTDGVPVQACDPNAYHSATTGFPVEALDPAAYYSTTTSGPAQLHDPAAAYYSATICIPPQAHDPAAYYSATTCVPAQAHDLAAYYSATAGVPTQAHGPAAYYLSADMCGTGYPPSSSQAQASWTVGESQDPNQAGIFCFSQPILSSFANDTSTVGGEHLANTFAGAVETGGTLDGL